MATMIGAVIFLKKWGNRDLNMLLLLTLDISIYNGKVRFWLATGRYF
jgi:hypothetical protein